MKTVPPFSTTATARSPRRFLETLVRSEEGRVTLLPALPDFLRDGELKGVCLRGAFHLEKLTFSDGKVTRCDIYSEKGRGFVFPRTVGSIIWTQRRTGPIRSSVQVFKEITWKTAY